MNRPESLMMGFRAVFLVPGGFPGSRSGLEPGQANIYLHTFSPTMMCAAGQAFSKHGFISQVVFTFGNAAICRF